MFENLQKVDEAIFRWVNQGHQNDFFDWLLPVLTELHSHLAFQLMVPLILIFWIYRQSYYFIAQFGSLSISLGATDAFSHWVIKETLVQRPRPPLNPALDVILRTHEHSGYSFTSNHAANMFCLATFIFLHHRRWGLLAFAFAAVIAYSRIYVGVHYFFDVLGGALLGVLSGYLGYKLYRFFIEHFYSERKL